MNGPMKFASRMILNGRCLMTAIVLVVSAVLVTRRRRPPARRGRPAACPCWRRSPRWPKLGGVTATAARHCGSSPVRSSAGPPSGSHCGALAVAVDAAGPSPSARGRRWPAVSRSWPLRRTLHLGGFILPVHHRQVNERWLDQFRPWVYGAGFGWQIGDGVRHLHQDGGACT